MTYKLRASLQGHSTEVRGVAAGVTADGKDLIVSCSRDKTAKIWTPSGDRNFQVTQSCESHTNFVICTAIVPPCIEYPEGLILTGGNDQTVLAFKIGVQNPVFRLSGHTGTVCSIAVTGGVSELLFLTGSWDMTAKVWRKDSVVSNLAGHTQAVWAVATIPGREHVFLTGSADREIRLWNKENTERIFKGHKDCVRDIAILEEDRFISCSNDATIMMWQISSGEVLYSFLGHSDSIYSLVVLPNEGFVSVSEDRTVRIWKDADTARQVIFLPATSVWSVAALSNGDIVTGSSDGVVRIFTRDPLRMAPLEEQQKFEESTRAIRDGSGSGAGGGGGAKAPSNPVGMPQFDFSTIQIPNRASTSAAPSPRHRDENDPAFIRDQLLRSPEQLALLKQNNPPLSEALLSGDFERFSRMIREMQQQHREREMQRIRLLTADSMDIEAQRLIEAEIRQKQVDANMEAAMEHSPEAFGTVCMLYINVIVNGVPVKAFIDSGAQTTIISTECAERCKIMRLVDTRFSGIAKGVGTQKIIGRIHMVQLQIGNDFFVSSFSVLEDQKMDMLLGLDMLKRHQCVIDLHKNVLKIGTTGTEAVFLPESELPKDH